MSVNRQQRRALERQVAGVDLATQGDKSFFEDHSGWRHRVRRMVAAEIASAEAMGALPPMVGGAERFTVVRKVTDALRLRIFIAGPPHKCGDETDEATSAALWRHYAGEDASSLNAVAVDHDFGARRGGLKQ